MARYSRSVCSLVLAFVVACTGCIGCSSKPDAWEGKKGPPRVVVSFPPLYSYVTKVGGEHVGVLSLCTSTGPHHYTYTASDAMKLRRADLFFANGLSLDNSFTNRAVENCGNPKIKEPINLGDLIPDHLRLEGGHFHHEHAPGVVHDHDHEDDPHVWMGIPQSIAMVEQIRDHLIRVDSSHRADYEKNAQDYIEELKALEQEGIAMLKAKKNRRIVTFHESLAYFSDTFGLEVVDVIQKNPGTKPSPAEFQSMVEVCKKENIRVIAVEPQYPKAGAAKVLVDELKKNGHEVALIELDPMETAEESELSPDWYTERVRANLAVLEKHLK